MTKKAERNRRPCVVTVGGMTTPERAHRIWRESEGEMSAPQIADQLAKEGHGRFGASAIRNWKVRDRWGDPPYATIEIIPPYESAPISIAPRTVDELDQQIADFSECAKAMRRCGLKTAAKVASTVEKFDSEKLTVSETAQLSRIATDMIANSAVLEEKVVSKLRAVKEKAIADGLLPAKTIEGEVAAKPSKFALAAAAAEGGAS